MGSVWFDLVVYQVSTFYYVWNWSKSLVWWVVVVLKATLLFIFGPNLRTRICTKTTKAEKNSPEEIRNFQLPIGWHYKWLKTTFDIKSHSCQIRICLYIHKHQSWEKEVQCSLISISTLVWLHLFQRGEGGGKRKLISVFSYKLCFLSNSI